MRKDELLDTLLLEVVKAIDGCVDVICAHCDGLNVIGHGHRQSADLLTRLFNLADDSFRVNFHVRTEHCQAVPVIASKLVWPANRNPAKPSKV